MSPRSPLRPAFRFVACLVIAASVISAKPSQAQIEAQADELQPRFVEARPFVEVLRAVRDQDVETFRNAFSQEVRDNVADEADWQAGLTYYTEMVASFCTDPEDFKDITFLFEGDNNLGELTIIYHGRRQFVVSVKREGFRWLINDK